MHLKEETTHAHAAAGCSSYHSSRCDDRCACVEGARSLTGLKRARMQTTVVRLVILTHVLVSYVRITTTM